MKRGAYKDTYCLVTEWRIIVDVHVMTKLQNEDDIIHTRIFKITYIDYKLGEIKERRHKECNQRNTMNMIVIIIIC